MSKPWGNPRVIVRFPQALVDGLDKLTQYTGETRSDILRRLVEQQLKTVGIKTSSERTELDGQMRMDE